MKCRWNRITLAAGSLLLLSLALPGCENGAAVTGTSAGNGAANSDPQPPVSESTPQTNQQPTPNPSPNTSDNGASAAQAPTTGHNQPLPATRNSPAAPGEPREISFDALIIQVQSDIVIRPWMFTDQVKELDGKNIRVKGYMLADAQLKGIKEFILLRNTECKFGPGGQADHLIRVTLNEGITAEFTDKPVAVEGVLTINPFQGPDGNTWSIYDLAGGKVTVERR